MICFMAIPSLRKLGKQAELRLFNKKVEELGYDSMEVLLASLFYRFALDDACAVLVVRKPMIGDEPFKGLKITQDFTSTQIAKIVKEMQNLAANTFASTEDNSFALVAHSPRVNIYEKLKCERGAWNWEGTGFKSYEYELTGKDGISIPAKFTRHSR